MRMIYGVFGYGRGHATRALAVLPQLERRHEVLLFASGTAYEVLSKDRACVRVPEICFRYRGAELELGDTVRHNLGRGIDLLVGGAELQAVIDRVNEFAPNVAICDVDPWTHHAAAALGVPRISFDHYGILVHCRPPLASLGDRVRHARDATMYRILTGRPERVVVSSFYRAEPRRPDVVCVGPLLREGVHQVRAARGEHVLAYFNQPALFTPRVEEALATCGVPVIAYGTGRVGRAGALELRAPAERGFLEDLARCQVVIGTAGNQLVGEAIHFGKPLLVMPEASVEQRVNANAIVELGIGERTSPERISRELVRSFLARQHRFRERARFAERDGRAAALQALESLALEIARPDRGRIRLGRVA
jgi:uncharacterized protein (TIGR00661 family)